MLMQCLASAVFFHTKCSVNVEFCSVTTYTHSHRRKRYPSVVRIMFYGFNLPTCKLAKYSCHQFLMYNFDAAK